MFRVAGLLILVLATGCARVDRASQSEPPGTGAMQEQAPALERQQAAAKREEVVAAEPTPIAPKQDGPVAVEPSPPPAAISPTQSAAGPEVPATKRPGQAPAAPGLKEPAPKKESPAPPPLDLAALETRLKETNAIGVFTKLTLKNQVDTLVDQFRGYYEGRIKTTLSQLRQPYDQLLLKVLALLQDSDPSLASAIAQSREAIWGILSDRDKFSKYL
jgi:hypothetical protein